MHGKEEKAKKVLALIARINCKQPLSRRVQLVTQEGKEQMLEERKSRKSNKIIIAAEMSITKMERMTSGEAETDYGTVLNKEDNGQTADNGFFIVSSENGSDQVPFTVSDNRIHKQIAYIKETIKVKSYKFYHWFLLLFENGWWKTTLILWYLW